MTTADELRASLESKPGVVGATITLIGGGYFDFLDPRPEMIRLGDIAWGLAHACRFGGQCRKFYSVAQHSYLVASMLPPELRFAGLMHDAAEAYIGDMVGPLKQLCPDFKAVEKRVEAVIAAKFQIVDQLRDPRIKHADLRALRTEQRDLTTSPADEWNGLGCYEPHPVRIKPLSPERARLHWLMAVSVEAPL